MCHKNNKLNINPIGMASFKKIIIETLLVIFLNYLLFQKYKLYSAVLLAALAYLDSAFGKKLEGWAHPDIQGSVEPTALVSASRNGKIFWGVSQHFYIF